jgi:hypothetical protein
MRKTTKGAQIITEQPLLESELAREQAYLDRCYEHLAALRARAESSLQDSIDLDVSTPQSVFEREVFASYSRKRLRAISSSEQQLVFGRLDFEDQDKPVYVGRIGLAGQDQERILVDWRAPVGSAFYRATALAPQGVVRRRTLITKGRRVVDINDDLLVPEKAGGLAVVAGEGALLHALVRERGEFMHDIVATIQAEQDEVIRSDPKASVVLIGGPGTGKSVVALHRTAYLMYERAAELERRGVLVVGPSQRFSRYISRVLPSLGETSVSIRSVFDLADPLVAREREPLGVARTKGAPAMSRVLKKFLIRTYPAPAGDLRVTIAGQILKLDAGRLRSIRSEVLQSTNSGMNSAGDRLLRALARALLEKSGRGRVRNEAIAALAGSLAENSTVEEAIEALLPQRLPKAAWRDMRRRSGELLAILQEHFPRDEAVALVTDLESSSEPQVGDLPLLDEMAWLLGPPVSHEDLEPGGEPEYEEVTTLQDRLDGSRQRGAAATKSYGFGHIVVDEAQDLSAMQWRMLARRGEDATWTIVGDPAQATLATSAEMESSVTRLLRGQRSHRFSLGINYRTPKEIMEYASRASGVSLGSLRSIRSGVEPVFFRYGDSAGAAGAAIRDAVSWLHDQSGSGCLIVLDPADRAALEGLAGGVEVIWALDAKGLEFDNVVLYRPEAIDRSSPADASLILIGATRATKRLAVVTRLPG